MTVYTSESDDQGPVEVLAPPLPDGINVWRQPQNKDALKDVGNLAIVGGKETTRLEMYKTYENFYEGEQQSKLLDRARQYLEQVSGIKYAENVCDLVVDAMADRLEIKGWTNTSDSKDVDSMSTEIWDHNNMAEVSKTAVSRTIELGDGFLVVDYDEDKKMPTIVFNPPNMMKAEYDPAKPTKMLYAVKRWCENTVSLLNPSGDDIQRRNLYYEDRIERYFSVHEDGEWIQFYDANDEYWPIPWTRNNEPPTDGKEDGRGIPVFHLKNKPRGKTQGRSELHKVIPLQNSLNKLWLDLFEVADQQGFPQRYATGTGTGESDGWKSGTGIVWTSTNDSAKFGQFDAADLNQIANMIDLRYKTIAGTTYTPIHMLVMVKNVPSGEALKKSEAGLTAKIKDRQPTFGHQFSSAMNMCMTLIKDNGTTIAGFVEGFEPQSTTIKPVWTQAENVDEQEQLQVATLKRNIGIPLKVVLKELGYSDVDKIIAMVKEEQDAQLATELAKFKANVHGTDQGGNNKPKPGSNSSDNTGGQGNAAVGKK